MQDISLHCLGASQEVGRSAFVLRTDKTMLLDYGIKIFGKDDKPEYPLPVKESLDIALISHAHMDHAGFVPHLYTFCDVKWVSTPPTKDLCELLWRDSMKIMGDDLPYREHHFKKALTQFQPIHYNKEISFGETKVKYLDAGHISGSSMIDVNFNNKRIFYTGDLKVQETRMHKGARYVEDAGVVIIDSTYAQKEHPDRLKSEKKIMDQVNETIKKGGCVLFPSFALGRSQELVSIIREHNKKVPIFLDGMGRAMSSIYQKHRGYIQNPDDFSRKIKTINMIGGERDRKFATEHPSVIISSAGMMEGGPVLGYLTRLPPESMIIFTGYSVEGTNGWKLRHDGYVTIDEHDLEVGLPVDYVDLSAHAGRSDILNFIKHANAEKVIIVHSDCAKAFETELKEDFGYDAIAPEIGQTIKL
ncbi:MAG: MBL fold metallo-hydrolase [Candidatus Micrarchaeota archaeon]